MEEEEPKKKTLNCPNNEVINMKRLKVLTACLAILALTAVLLSSCSDSNKPENTITGPSNQYAWENWNEGGGFPSSNFSWPVPFLQQVPPGSTDSTHNSAQACAASAQTYYHSGTVSSGMITQQNTWLAGHTNDNEFNDPNGVFIDDDNLWAFTDMLHSLYGIDADWFVGDSLANLVNQVHDNDLVMARILTLNQSWVNNGGLEHWVLIIGWNTNGHVIVHDPGISGGNQMQRTVSEFEIPWATTGKKWLRLHPISGGGGGT